MDLVGKTFFYDWEVSLIIWLQAHIGPVFTAIATFISVFGGELACVAVIGFLYWCYDKRFGRFVGLNILVGAIIGPMIKNIFVRRRPYFDTSAIRCLDPVDRSADIYDIAAQQYSFPSVHSVNSITMYGSIAKYLKKKTITVIAVVMILMIGISRIFLGVHYPTDVICGWFIGLIILFVVPLLQSKFKNPLYFYVILLAIFLPGFFYCKSNDFFSGYGMLLGFIIGDALEQKYVKFENTRSPIRSVIRVIGGAAIFFGLNYLFKLPFSKEFLESGTILAFIVRTLRYTLITILDFCVYPLLFKLYKKKR